MDDSFVSLLSLSSSSQGDLEVTLESLDSLNLSTDLDSTSLSDTDTSTDTDDPSTSNSAGIEAGLREPLHEDSQLTTWDCYLHIMRYCLRHSLTKTAVSDLLGLVGLLLPKATSTSLYKFKKTFLSLYEDISFNSHYCCSSCHSPFDSRDSDCCNGCDMGSVEFLTISVEAQLRRKLQGRKFTCVLLYCMLLLVYLCTYRT